MADEHVDGHRQAVTEAGASRRALIIVVAGSNLLVAMLFNLVIPLIPVLPEELGTSAANASWVATGFFLAGAVASPVVGRLADSFGNSRLLVTCLWLLVAGSIACAVAPTLAVLLAGRVMQGLALPMTSVSLSILRHQMPLRSLPSAVGWAGAAMGVGNGIGLIGGGYLIEQISWRAVFWATAALTVPVAVAAHLVVPKSPARPRESLDLGGVAGLALILVCLLLPLSKMADWGLGWPSIALIVLAAFWTPWWVLGRLRSSSPVVDLRSLRSVRIAATHVVAIAAGFSGFMCFVVTTHALQAPEPEGFAMTLTTAGLVMTPASLSFLGSGPLASVLVLRLGMRQTLSIAGAVTAAGALTMAFLGTTVPALMISSFCIFVGNGILLSALPVATAAYSSASEIGSVNGVNALARTTGIAFASGAFALVIGVVEPGDVRDVVLGGQLLGATAGLGIVALAMSAIPRRPTEHQRGFEEKNEGHGQRTSERSAAQADQRTE